MTPNITVQDMRARTLFNPARDSTPHLAAFIDQAKARQETRQFRLSDHMIGAVKMAVAIGEIRKKDADVFETCFVRGVKIRKTREHEGLAFLDPDGNVMSIDGVTYSGSETAYDDGNYDLTTV